MCIIKSGGPLSYFIHHHNLKENEEAWKTFSIKSTIYYFNLSIYNETYFFVEKYTLSFEYDTSLTI